MVESAVWEFYGRSSELAQLKAILARKRWFFGRITGRRRIGKTTLIQRALEVTGVDTIFYVQIPDSAPAGVLSAFADAMDTFSLDSADFPRPTTLLEIAQTIGSMVRRGFVVAVDEFQYFARSKLREFPSHLQAVVDGLSRDAADVRGGLFVLGSVHTELVKLLEDRDAPLYNRTTDPFELDHLDIASVVEILSVHADPSPERLLFFWNLFEGVPKFYRDCFEQGVLAAERTRVLHQMFFRSSSPLRNEAENWFLSELRGRYDVVLKYVARHPGCTNGDLKDFVRTTSRESAEQVGGYIKVLSERFRMIEKRLPIFAKPTAKKGRYYVCDNFLRAWLHALSQQVQAIDFRPTADLVARADARLAEAEGYALERLAHSLYAERSRKGVGDFRLSRRLQGFWDRSDVEIDMVALDEDERRIRFATCKRSPEKLVRDLARADGHIERFLDAHGQYRSWTVERVAIAPRISSAERAMIEARAFIPQDLVDLTRGL